MDPLAEDAAVVVGVRLLLCRRKEGRLKDPFLLLPLLLLPPPPMMLEANVLSDPLLSW